MNKLQSKFVTVEFKVTASAETMTGQNPPTPPTSGRGLKQTDISHRMQLLISTHTICSPWKCKRTDMLKTRFVVWDQNRSHLIEKKKKRGGGVSKQVVLSTRPALSSAYAVDYVVNRMVLSDLRKEAAEQFACFLLWIRTSPVHTGSGAVTANV